MTPYVQIFADDTKGFCVVSNKNDTDRLQIDLINLGKWSHDWLIILLIRQFIMTFHTKKPYEVPNDDIM